MRLTRNQRRREARNLALAMFITAPCCAFFAGVSFMCARAFDAAPYSPDTHAAFCWFASCGLAFGGLALFAVIAAVVAVVDYA